MSAQGRKRKDAVFTLGSNFNCCTALGKSLSVGPPLIKRCPSGSLTLGNIDQKTICKYLMLRATNEYLK